MKYLLTGYIVIPVLVMAFVKIVHSTEEEVYTATIVSLPTNTSGLVGSTLSVYCGIEGEQQSWEVMQWIKENPEPHIVAANNDTVDDTKYMMSMRYNLTVKNVQVEDHSLYMCRMGVQEYEASLTVSVRPSHVSVSKQERDSEMNLTCTSHDSRPQAIFTWLQGEVDVTHEAFGPYSDLNQTLFGDSWSILPVTMESSDAVLYACVVHLPGVEAFARKEIIVSSGFTRLQSSSIFTTVASLAVIYTWCNFR